jgi:hypothetical protein
MPPGRFAGMRIDAGVAVFALEREQSLRIEPGVRVDIGCAAGVLWVTQEGDMRDLFLARGESLRLIPRGTAIITALEPARVGVTDLRAHRTRASALSAPAVRCLRLCARLLAALRPASTFPTGLTVRR